MIKSKIVSCLFSPLYRFSHLSVFFSFCYYFLSIDIIRLCGFFFSVYPLSLSFLFFSFDFLLSMYRFLFVSPLSLFFLFCRSSDFLFYNYISVFCILSLLFFFPLWRSFLAPISFPSPSCLRFSCHITICFPCLSSSFFLCPQISVIHLLSYSFSYPPFVPFHYSTIV